MLTPRPTRRELLLVVLTAVMCFSIAIPLTTAATKNATREYTIWPQNSVRFANLDWNCYFFGPGQGGTPKSGSGGISCNRESNAKALSVFVTGEWVRIFPGCNSGPRCATVQRNRNP